MIDREIARREALMLSCGFGPEVMKHRKVCRVCGRGADAKEDYCRSCGAVLPEETLFDLYKSRHLYCRRCGTVVASAVQFCPGCGERLRRRLLFRRSLTEQAEKKQNPKGGIL